MEAAANLQSIRMMSAYRDGPFKSVAGPGGTYLASDGGWIQIAAVKNHEFKGVCEVLGLQELIGDPRFATTTTDRYANAAYPGRARARDHPDETAAEWRDKLTEAGLQNEMRADLRRVRRSPAHRGQRADQPGPSAGLRSALGRRPIHRERRASPRARPTPRSPRLSEHARAILAELGYATADIDRLAAEKVVAA